MKLAKLFCIEDVLITGRNKDGSPDICFVKEKEYYFIFDKKKNQIFTLNEANEVHFLKLSDDKFTNKYFEVLEINDADFFKLDEITLRRFLNLSKRKYDYE